MSGTFLLGAASLILAGGARAQEYGPPPGAPAYGPPPGYAAPPPDSVPETVEVTAPHYRVAPEQKLNGPLEKVSLSSAIPYDDLDLRTRAGARELKHRVFETAREVCGQLADYYPVYQLNGTHCFKDAYENGLVRADAAISAKRVEWRQSYYSDY